ncbi:hypothetical protein T492DRAFT_891077 [Pavlovales sp. CCMP2436]|nr:hypothetical protein T492DRAFT_891077 [Pavlovales sp. CCMP2436]
MSGALERLRVRLLAGPPTEGTPTLMTPYARYEPPSRGAGPARMSPGRTGDDGEDRRWSLACWLTCLLLLTNVATAACWVLRLPVPYAEPWLTASGIARPEGDAGAANRMGACWLPALAWRPGCPADKEPDIVLLPHLNILPGPAHVQDLITRHRRGRREPDIRTCSYCEASLLPGSDIQLAYDCSFCSQTCRARFMPSLLPSSDIHLPVIDGEHLFGFLSLCDILRPSLEAVDLRL